MAFDGKETLILAILTLFLGKFLNQRVGLLRQYNIPEPVTGGVLASVIFALLYSVSGNAASFDLSNRDMLLVVFFTTVGLNAKFATLLAGGKPLVILIICASLFLVAQNLTGVAVSWLVDAPLLTGRALVPEHAITAGTRPIEAGGPVVFLPGVAICQALPGGAAIDVFLGDIGEVCLETATCASV